MSWQDNKFLRQESCWRCAFGHSGLTECITAGRIVKVYCDLTHRMGSTIRACYCEKFKPLYKEELFFAEDGIPVRNRTSLDYRTKKQWAQVGRRIKDNAKGLDMHVNLYSSSSRIYRYYLKDETEIV